MSNKDYYTILGVSKSASKDEIKKAFRKLAQKHHPDKGGDESVFKEASEAYSVLSDDKKRAEYDAYGRVFGGGAQGGGAGGFEGFDFSQFTNGRGGAGFEFDMGDIFSEFFGGSGRSGGRRGRDISIDLEIDFKDSIYGTDRTVLLSKYSECNVCDGTGAKKGTEVIECATCGGNGKIHETKQSFLGSISTTRVCEKCRGTGKTHKEDCGECAGEGVRKQEEEIKIMVPTGINDGEMIRLSGKGEATPGGVPGDLYVKVHVKSHSTIRREGNDLVTDLTVKLTDALLGGSYTVETIDDPITVKIPAGIASGEILRVRNKGVMIDDSRRGDLLIRVHITLPSKLSKKAKKAVEELREEGI